MFLHPATALGVAVFAALALGWPIAIASRDAGVLDFWHAQSVGRFESHFGPNTRPWYYYLYTIPVITLPWTPMWIAGVTLLIKERKLLRGDPRLLFLLWLVIGIAFFSMSSGKREHYILPCLAPLSLIAATALRWPKLESLSLRRLVPIGATVTALSGLWSLDILVRPNWNSRQQTAAMISRNGAAFESADQVVQFACNDHSWIFPIQKEMKWIYTAEELVSAIRQQPKTIVVVPKSEIANLPKEWHWETVDTPDESKIWRRVKPTDIWVLMRPTTSDALAPPASKIESRMAN